VALTAQARDLNASAEYKGAQTVLALANADKAHADAAKTLSDTHLARFESALGLLDKILQANQAQGGAVAGQTPQTPQAPQMAAAAQSGAVSPATQPFQPQ
jgi:hypothetical protein